MRGRPKKLKIVDKEDELSEEESCVGRLEYKILSSGDGNILAEPLFKYLEFLFLDKADKLSVLVKSICSASVNGEEVLFFQYRAQGRRNGRLEYTPCTEMLDTSATSEWEIATVPPPSNPVGIVQNSSNKTAEVSNKRKITVPMFSSTSATIDVVVATSEKIAKQKKSPYVYLSIEDHAAHLATVENRLAPPSSTRRGCRDTVIYSSK